MNCFHASKRKFNLKVYGNLKLNKILISSLKCAIYFHYMMSLQLQASLTLNHPKNSAAPKSRI